jgi:hypothetical protein
MMPESALFVKHDMNRSSMLLLFGLFKIVERMSYDYSDILGGMIIFEREIVIVVVIVVVIMTIGRMMSFMQMSGSFLDTLCTRASKVRRFQ